MALSRKYILFHNRKQNILYPWDLPSSRPVLQENEEIDMSGNPTTIPLLETASSGHLGRLACSTPQAKFLENTEISPDASPVISPLDCCQRACFPKKQPRCIVTSLRSPSSHSTLDGSDNTRVDDEKVLQAALRGGALSIGRKIMNIYRAKIKKFLLNT